MLRLLRLFSLIVFILNANPLFASDKKPTLILSHLNPALNTVLESPLLFPLIGSYLSVRELLTQLQPSSRCFNEHLSDQKMLQRIQNRKPVEFAPFYKPENFMQLRNRIKHYAGIDLINNNLLNTILSDPIFQEQITHMSLDIPEDEPFETNNDFKNLPLFSRLRHLDLKIYELGQDRNLDSTLLAQYLEFFTSLLRQPTLAVTLMVCPERGFDLEPLSKALSSLYANPGRYSVNVNFLNTRIGLPEAASLLTPLRKIKNFHEFNLDVTVDKREPYSGDPMTRDESPTPFVKALEDLSPIRKLNLRDVVFKDPIIPELTRSTPRLFQTLQELKLSFLNASQDFAALGGVVATAPELRHLALYKLSVDNQGAKAIKSLLCESKTLKELHIYCDDIRSQEFTTIAEGVVQSNCLEDLALDLPSKCSHFEFKEAFPKFAASVAGSKSLRRLRFGCCCPNTPDFTQELVDSAGKSSTMSFLKIKWPKTACSPSKQESFKSEAEAILSRAKKAWPNLNLNFQWAFQKRACDYD